MTSGFRIALIIVAVVVVGIGGYMFGNYHGNSRGYSAGFQQAKADEQKAQDEADRLAAEQAALAASADEVFQTSDPAATPEPNPLEETKKTLNPF